MKYYVLRTYSHTDRQQLWKVMTRPTFNKATAEQELEFHKNQADLTKHTFFIVMMES